MAIRQSKSLYAPLSALALATVLAGCASTHGLKPQSTLQDADRFHASTSLGHAPVSDVAWPKAQWWTAYGDPQLDALMQEALADSPGVAAADARTRKAYAQAGLAEAGIYPTLGGSAQVAAVQLPETLLPAPIGGKLMHSEVLMLNFAWTPDIWGGKHAKWQSAVGAARAQEADAQAARLTLESNIARTYAALAQAWDARDVAERDLTRNSGLHALATQRVKAGIDNQIALTQIASAEDNARAQMQAADQQISALRNALAMLAGKGPDRGLSIERPQLKLDGIAIPSLLPSELVSRRPDVAAARWHVEAASKGIKAAKSDFYPSLNLSGMVGLAAGKLGDLFKSDAGLVFGGPAVSLPIFDGGRLRSQLRGADADFDLAIAGYDQTVLNAIRETTDAVQSARELDAQISAATRARDQQARSAMLVAQRQKAGLANQLDVLTAQKPILQLDQQLSALRARRMQSAIDLEIALGGGVPVQLPAQSSISASGKKSQ